jgi:hypothetical protein
MEAKTSLHCLVLDYRRSGKGLDKVMERIAELVFASPQRFGFECDDEAAEALFRYRHRIAGLADRFEDRGLPFEAYLVSSLRFLSRTVRRNHRREAERQVVCERAESGSSSDEFAPGFEADISCKDTERPRIPLPKDPKMSAAFGSRLVFLFLKCVWDADDADASRVAEAAGVDPAWLGSAATQARRSLEAERGRYERMAASRNRSWCRLRILEARLRDETEQSRRLGLQASLERERSRFARAMEEMRAFKPVVPNSVVARILDVPKGTVDSGLYYLKKARGLKQPS